MRALLFGALLAAAMLLGARAGDDEYDYYETLPEDGLADTIAHVEVPLQLTPAAVTALVANTSLALALRTVVAASSTAEGGHEGDPRYAIIMSASAGEDTYDFTALYDLNAFNDGNDDAVEAAEDGGGEVTRRRLALQHAAAAFAAQQQQEAQRRRALVPGVATEPTVVVWYLFGGSFAYVAGAKGVDAGALAARMGSALASGPSAWAALTDAADGGALGDMDGAALATAVDASFVVATPPRLRYMPFGSFESSSIGSFIGIAVFVLGVVFIGIPSMVADVRARLGWRKVPVGAPGGESV